MLTFCPESVLNRFYKLNDGNNFHGIEAGNDKQKQLVIINCQQNAANKL